MNIRPFNAIKPRPSSVANVAAVPYDVVDTAEAQALASGNPESFLHVSRPEIDLPEGTSCSSKEAYEQARKTLDSFVEQGILAKDNDSAFYAYRQIMGSHSQTGIVATFDTHEYLNGTLKRHEKTRADKEDDRTRHIATLNAQTGPVFLTYRDTLSIAEFTAKACESEPIYDFVADDGIRHTVWKFPLEANEEIVKMFSSIPAAYIADGHHRAAAASRMAKEKNFEGEAAWFMAVAFPSKQLKLLPYNRLIADLNGLSKEDVLAKAKEIFTVTEAENDEVAESRHARMFLDGKWYDIAWEVPADADVVSSLDVSVLQDRFLAPVLGIDDPRTSSRISFMGGIRGLDELAGRVTSGRDAIAFSMYPVTVDEMMAIADADAIMPPKSTWFEPKLRSGLFVHSLD